MNNIELRRQVLQDGTFQQYCQDRKKAIREGQIQEATTLTDKETGELLKRNTANGEYFGISQKEAEECEKARKCRDAQRRKVADQLAYIIREGLDPHFITFTLTDEALQKQHETQKKAITRALGVAQEWALNEDYGKTTGRKHFHAVVGIPPGTYTLEEYRDKKGHLHYRIPEIQDKYRNGNVNVEPIRMKTVEEIEESIARVSRYEAKLSLHSVKVKQTYISTKRGTPYQAFKKQRNWLQNHLRRIEEGREKAQDKRVEEWYQDYCEEALKWQESEDCQW